MQRDLGRRNCCDRWRGAARRWRCVDDARYGDEKCASGARRGTRKHRACARSRVRTQPAARALFHALLPVDPNSTASENTLSDTTDSCGRSYQGTKDGPRAYAEEYGPKARCASGQRSKVADEPRLHRSQTLPALIAFLGYNPLPEQKSFGGVSRRERVTRGWPGNGSHSKPVSMKQQ